MTLRPQTPASSAPSPSIERVVRRILQSKITIPYHDAVRIAEEALDAAREEVRAEKR